MKTLPPCDHDECPPTQCTRTASDEAVVCKELFGALTAKTVDFDKEMWRDQDSSCLLCHTPLGLDFGAEWPDDPRLLLCWGCMSQLCAELIAKLEAPNDKVSDGYRR